MKVTLFATFVALLLAGCGEEVQKKVVGGEAQKKQVQDDAKDDPSVPILIPCEACKKEVSKKAEKCLNCGHPAPDSVIAFKKAQEEERLRAEEEARFKLQGGFELLAKIREAKASNATELMLSYNKITDLTPLKGLSKLERLWLENNQIRDLTPLAGLTKLRYLELGGNKITDLTPLKGLTNLRVLSLHYNQITDLAPLKGLTKLETLDLSNNQITDLTPLVRLTNLKVLGLVNTPTPDDQKEMLTKTLPNCRVIDRYQPPPAGGESIAPDPND